MMNYLRMILEIPKASQDQIGYNEACPGTYRGSQKEIIKYRSGDTKGDQSNP